MTRLPFLTLWQAEAPTEPIPIAEHLVCDPARWPFSFPWHKWRFDFAWDAPYFVAVELDGGQYAAPYGGRHARDSDRLKIQSSVALGWRVLQFSNQQWEADPLRCIELIRATLAVARGTSS